MRAEVLRQLQRPLALTVCLRNELCQLRTALRARCPCRKQTLLYLWRGRVNGRGVRLAMLNYLQALVTIFISSQHISTCLSWPAQAR